MVTIKDVARECGVSIATVNRAISNKVDISEKTREKVLAKIDEMGYRPHFMARSLVSGSTKIIGFIVFDIKNPFFTELVSIINSELRKRGYLLHISIIENSLDEEKKALDHLASMKTDGIFMVPLNKGKEFSQWIHKLNIPIISLFNELSSSINFFGVDEKGVMEESVKFIHSKGYKNLLYLSPPLHWVGEKNLDTIEKRLEGVKKACGSFFSDQRHEMYIACDYVNYCFQWLEKQEGKSAILCSNDIYALDIIKQANALNLKIPDDFGLMGFDDLDMLHYLDIKLTTISYPIEEVAKAAVDKMMELLLGDLRIINKRFPAQIQVRNSV